MNIDIAELKKRANTVAIIGRRMTLKPEGDHYVGCCPIHGEKTPSFKLDQRQGEWLWKCFGCNKGGDVLRFIELVDKVDIRKAIEILEKETTVKNEKWVEQAGKVAANLTPLGEQLGEKKPKVTLPLDKWIEGPVKRLAASQAGMDWLRNERALSDDVIAAMNLGYVQTHTYKIKEGMEHVRDKGWVMMPRIQDGKVVAVKLRSIVEKVFTQVAGMDGGALFNAETINSMEPVYVTEGEFDAMVFEMAGLRAVSVPSAGATLSPENRIRLKMAERIYLAGDNDGGVGSEYMKKLAIELGSNTHRIIWPDAKDANDFLRDKCERSAEQFYGQIQRLSYKARNAAPEGYASLLDRLREGDDSDMANDPRRVHWPMADIDDMAYTPAGDSIIIYSSYSGTGKSMLARQLLIHEAKRGEIIVDLSPEIRGKQFDDLITSQVIGPTIEGGLRRTGLITKAQKLAAATALDKPTLENTDFRYYVGHEIPASNEQDMLAYFEQIITTTGCTRFVIDTFHRLFSDNGRLSQTEAEGRMAKKLEELGKKYLCSFILVCQSNAEAEGVENLKKDTLGTLRGSKEVRDSAAHIYLLHRKRHDQKEEGDGPARSLELEATLFLRKDRYPGSGKPQAHMLLKEEWSLFMPKTHHSGGNPPAQEPSGPSDESQFI